MTGKTPAKRAAAPPDTTALVELPTFEPKRGLTPLRRRFAAEFVQDMEPAAAYRRASANEVTDDTARVEGYRLIHLPIVQAEIQRLLDQREAVTGITADGILMHAWEIATADARDLVDVEVGSCRHCWGMYNQYQYTEAEFSAAQDKHIREESAKRKKDDSYEPKAFPEKGGPGYDPKRTPNPECPECWGDGKQRVRVKDTRDLPRGAAALFAGTKVDKHGNVSVVIQDRAAYLNLCARYLGMDKRVIAGDPDNPLFMLLKQIQDQHAALPVVVNDPEAIDVAARVVSAPGADSHRPRTGWKAAK